MPSVSPLLFCIYVVIVIIFVFLYEDESNLSTNLPNHILLIMKMVSSLFLVVSTSEIYLILTKEQIYVPQNGVIQYEINFFIY